MKETTNSWWSQYGGEDTWVEHTLDGNPDVDSTPYGNVWIAGAAVNQRTNTVNGVETARAAGFRAAEQLLRVR